MSAISAIGTIQQGNAAAAAGQYNADTENYNATAAGSDGAVKLKQAEIRQDLQIGNEKAQYGASGVSSSSGSALAMLKQSAAQAATDSVNIQNTTAAKVYGYKRSAGLSVYEGQQRQAASVYTAEGQVLGTAQQAAELA